MSSNKVLYFLYAIICFVLFMSTGYAKGTQDERHIEVTLRMVGHQVLLNSGDSTSRVMPIVQDEDHYIIPFQSEFEIVPDELVKTVSKILKDAGFEESYILEVEQCNSKEIVYSYEMTKAEQSDIIPCKARKLPESCYRILFTLTEVEDSMTALKTNDSDDSFFFIQSRLGYFISALFLVILGLSFYLFKRKRPKSQANPHIIPLGEYQFDKRNTELLYDEQRIELTAKEADLLILLYDAANTTIERDVILKMVWGDEGDYVGRTLDVFISKLRKKLKANSSVKIVNIRGVGYKLVMDV